MSLVFNLDAHDRAAKAMWQARRAWNQLLSGCGGWGAKFSHRLRTFMDEMQSCGPEAQLMAEAIRLRVIELNRRGKSALEHWE